MTQIIHISDIHNLPMPKYAFWRLFNKRITGYLNLKFNRKNSFYQDVIQQAIHKIIQEKVDYIVVSGDLVNLALPEEFLLVKQRIDSLNNNIALCFGNHDAYLPGSLKKIAKVFNIKNFPYVRIVNDIAIINLSSAIATPPFFALGYFDKNQAKKLDIILSKYQDKFKIINIHHPPMPNILPKYKALFGIRNLWDILNKHKIDLILHGHSHRSTVNFYNNVPIVGVGNFASKNPNNANYNKFYITNMKCKLTQYNFDGNIIKEYQLI